MATLILVKIYEKRDLTYHVAMRRKDKVTGKGTQMHV